MYKVIERFRDLTDGHLYEAGEVFPHDGREIPASRLEALANGHNLSAKTLIAEVKEIPIKASEAPQRASRGRKKAK